MSCITKWSNSNNCHAHTYTDTYRNSPTIVRRVLSRKWRSGSHLQALSIWRVFTSTELTRTLHKYLRVHVHLWLPQRHHHTQVHARLLRHRHYPLCLTIVCCYWCASSHHLHHQCNYNSRCYFWVLSSK